MALIRAMKKKGMNVNAAVAEVRAVEAPTEEASAPGTGDVSAPR